MFFRVFRISYIGHFQHLYTLSEAWSGVNWADLMAAQGAFGTDLDGVEDLGDLLVLQGTTKSTRKKSQEYFGRSIDLSLKSVPKAPWAAMRSAEFTPLQASDRL